MFLPIAVQVEGEMLSLTKITRSEMGAYLCIGTKDFCIKAYLITGIIHRPYMNI